MELGTAQWAQTELGTIDMDGVGHSGHGHRVWAELVTMAMD